jgi:hypothetical protein
MHSGGGDIIATAPGDRRMHNLPPEVTLPERPFNEEFGLSAKAAIKMLTEQGYKHRKPGKSFPLANPEKVAEGLIEQKMFTVRMPDGTIRLYEQIFITAKGLTHLAMGLANQRPDQKH